MSRTTTIPLLVLLLAITAGALAPPAEAGRWGRGRDTIHGSGHVVTETRQHDGFDAVRLEGVADIDIRIGDGFAVEVEAEDNLIELVETRVERGRLVVAMDEDHTINTDEGIHVRVTMPALEAVDLEGVGSMSITGLDATSLDIVIEGVGNLEAEGRVQRLDLEMEGVGQVDLRDLTAQYARVRHSGVGEVRVHVEDELDARVSGIGSIRYSGEPQHVSRREDGLGRIRSAGR